MQNCETVHPLDSPIRINVSANCVICISCVVNTLGRSELIPSVRRAALAELNPVISDTTLLKSIGSSVLNHLHERLLDTLLSGTGSSDLSYKLADFIAKLCHHCDAVTNPPQFVWYCLTKVVDAVIKNHQTNVVHLIAKILNHDSSSVCDRFAVILSTKAFQFAHEILSNSILETDWPDVALVLALAIKCFPPEFESDRILSLLDERLPPRRKTKIDLAYLSVVHTIFNSSSSSTKAASYVIHSGGPFIGILKKVILSLNHSDAELAYTIIMKLVSMPLVAPELGKQGIIEYVIEGLRRKPPNFSALEALAAFVTRDADLMVPKWTFALETVMTVSETVTLRYISPFLITMRSAFEKAPVPVFSQHILHQTVGFIMRLLLQVTQSKNLKGELDGFTLIDEAVSILVALLNRYEISPDGVYNVLVICHAGTDPACNFSSATTLFIACIRQLKRLLEECPNNINLNQKARDVRQLGRHMMSSVLEAWRELFTGKLRTLEMALSILETVENVIQLMHLFILMLDPVLVTTGCASQEEQLTLKRWCWLNIPICVGLGFKNVFKSKEKCRKTIQSYIASIMFSETDEEHPIADDMPTCEEVFLKGLSNCRFMSKDTSYRIFKTGIMYKNVEVICRTDQIIASLTSRLNYLAMLDKTTEAHQAHATEILQDISTVCSAHHLIFPSQCLTEDVVKMVASYIKRINSDVVFDIFCELICCKTSELQFSSLWEAFSKTNETRAGSTPKWDSKLCDLLVQNSCAASSLLEAILHSPIPQRITYCVQRASRNYHERSKLAMVLDKAGASRHVVSLLTSIQNFRSLDNKSSPHESEKQRAHVERYSVDCLRVCSFLSLIALGEMFPESLSLWELFHVFRDFLSTVDAFLEQDGNMPAIHAAILHCLLMIVKSTKDPKVLLYVSQHVILSHCVTYLKHVSILPYPFSPHTNNILSTISCFLTLLLHQGVVQEQCYAMLSTLSSHVDVWDNLLVSHETESLINIHSISRITNVCALLETYINYANKSDSQFKTFRSFISYRALTFVAIATASPNIFLCQSAYSLLTTLMKVDRDGLLQSMSGAQLRMVAHLVQVDVRTFHRASRIELAFVKELVICGLVDANLVKLHDALINMWKCWIELDGAKKDKSERNVLLSTIAQLILVIRERIKNEGMSHREQPEIVPEQILCHMQQYATDIECTVPSPAFQLECHEQVTVCKR